MKPSKQTTSVTLSLANEQATLDLGCRLANSLDAPMQIGLSGELGAGKTTLTRGFLRFCGYSGAVKSPTFTLVESYEFALACESSQSLGRRSQALGLHHFDLYRVADPEELEFIGFDEYLADDYDVIVEWPEIGADWLSEVDFYVNLSHQGNQRLAIVEAHSPAAKIWLEKSQNENKFSNLRK